MLLIQSVWAMLFYGVDIQVFLQPIALWGFVYLQNYSALTVDLVACLWTVGQTDNMQTPQRKRYPGTESRTSCCDATMVASKSLYH